MASITQLLHLSKTGSKTAFAQLFRRVWPSAVGSVGRSVLDRGIGAEGDDISQLTMIRFWEFLRFPNKSQPDRLKNRDDLYRFLRFMLRETQSKFVRNENRQKRDTRRTVSFNLHAHSPTEFGHFDEVEFNEVLAITMEETCPTRRSAIALHLFEGLSIASVATRVDRSERAIERYLQEFRARFWEKWKA